MKPSINAWRQLASALGLVAVTAMPSLALDVWLVAKPLTKTMPDATAVPMWGFASATANFVAVGAATVPGPTITIPTADTTLIIHLRNDLPQPVSIVIPGLASVLSPVRFTDGQSRSRVSAFTAQAAANGGTRNYTFTARPGTFLYQSGSHPSVQVPMGLYGAVKKNATATTAYTGVTIDNEAVVLYSEVDPALNTAVTTNTFGTLAYPGSIKYAPTYFLINGDPYPAGGPVLAHAPLAAERVLLRLLNAGLKSHIPTVQGLRMQVVAEDGNLYPFQHDEYDVLLPAGKTIDAVLTVTAPGRVPIYDRALDLTNAGQPAGGLLANVGVAQTASMFQQGLFGLSNSANIDTSIRRSSATQNYGTVSTLYVGTTTSSTSTYRSIVEFNLASIPAGATVTGCTLTVYVNQRTSPTAGHVHRLCGEHWLDGNGQSETQSTWNRWRSPNSNTWGTAGASSTAACNAGGDYETGGVPYTPPLSTGLYTFPDLSGLCQDAVALRSGWLRLRISQDLETTLNNYLRLDSSEGGTAARRPKLTVAWFVPSTPTTTTTTTTTTATTTTTTTTTATTTTATTTTATTATTTSTTSPTTTTTSTTTTSTSTTSTSTTGTTLVPPTPPVATVLADVSVDSSNQTSNLGTQNQLHVDGGVMAIYRTFIRVQVSNVGGRTVTSALLNLRVLTVTNAQSVTGGQIHLMTDCSWGETTTNWSNQPSVGGPVIQTLGAVGMGQLATFNVTTQVPGDGTYCFAIDAVSTDGVDYHSREASTASNRPQFVVQVAP